MSYSREYSYSPIPPLTPLYPLSSFLALYIIFMKAQFFHVNLRFQKEKNEEMLHLQPQRYVSISLHLHLYANYPSFRGFRWRQICCL